MDTQVTIAARNFFYIDLDLCPVPKISTIRLAISAYLSRFLGRKKIVLIQNTNLYIVPRSHKLSLHIVKSNKGG